MSDQPKLPYEAAMHAVQTGVAMEMRKEQEEHGDDWHQRHHKHLRVGINSAMCESAALIRLLVDKGITTYEEWQGYLEDEVNREVERYRERLQEMLGVGSVTLF